jgi:hypothetical protein
MAFGYGGRTHPLAGLLQGLLTGRRDRRAEEEQKRAAERENARFRAWGGVAGAGG